MLCWSLTGSHVELLRAPPEFDDEDDEVPPHADASIESSRNSPELDSQSHQSARDEVKEDRMGLEALEVAPSLSTALKLINVSVDGV